MEKRRLAHGLFVAPLAFGGNVFGWTVNEKTSFDLLDRFTEKGFNLIDTADSYSTWVPGHKGGESETIIGRWLKARGNRQKVVIATKVGSDMGEGRSLKKKYIYKAVDDSLRRLQTDYIDLYQSHWDDPSTPVSETIDAYAQLMRDGKVRVLGASNLGIDRLRESVNYGEHYLLPYYETLQPEYNLYNRQRYESEYEDFCKERSMGVIPYYSLASGFLTGKYRSAEDVNKSARGGGVIKNYLNERGLRILKALDQVAGKYGTTPAAVSLAWLMARPSITAPIASATSESQLDELMHAAELKLDATDMSSLDAASSWQQ